MPDTPVDEPSPAMDSTEGLARKSPPPEVIAAAEPTPPSAVDLHVKLGPLQDRGVTRPRSAQVWAWALAGGGLAGLASFLIGESLVDWFVAPPPPPPAAGAGPSGLSEADYTATTKALVGNAALAFGLLGGLLGLLLGVAGGMVRSSLRSAVGAGLIGALLGVAAGVGASAAVVPTYARILNRPDTMDFDLGYAVLALGAIWGVVGAAAGAAFGIGMGGWRRAGLGLAGGLLGGILGAAAFEMLAAVAFPLDGATQAVSNSRESRLMARALSALFISAGVAALVVPTRFEEPSEPVA